MGTGAALAYRLTIRWTQVMSKPMGDRDLFVVLPSFLDFLPSAEVNIRDLAREGAGRA